VKHFSLPFKHILTHQKIFAQFIVIETPNRVAIEGYQYYSKIEMEDIAKPVLLLKFISSLSF
jgi:hypothetical protein